MIELNDEKEKYKAISIFLGMLLYLIVTICYTMYKDVQHQEYVIKNQNDTIEYLLIEKLGG